MNQLRRLPKLICRGTVGVLFPFFIRFLMRDTLPVQAGPSRERIPEKYRIRRFPVPPWR